MSSNNNSLQERPNFVIISYLYPIMEKILCRECKQSKELDEFYRRKSDGKLTNKICKTCRREQAKNAYY